MRCSAPAHTRALLAAACTLLALAGPAQAVPFTLWLTETPAGGSAQYNAQLKGGVRSYVFDGLGYTAANYSAGATIAAAQLGDPSSVAVEASGSLLIANRGFNAGAGSVSRVTFTGNTANPATVVQAGIDTGPHEIALTGNGDLIVSSFSGGAKRYPGVTGAATVSSASGTERGTVVGGSVLYSTSGSGAVQSFNTNTGALLGSFGVAGASLLHYGTLFGGSLYFADIGSGGGGAGGGIYKITLDGSGNPTASSKVASVDGAIDVAFSPSGDEMFVTGHFSGLLTGFAVSGGTVAATSNLSIDGGTLASWNGAHVQYGGLAVTAVPEPTSPALMLGGLAAMGLWLRRRAAA